MLETLIELHKINLELDDIDERYRQYDELAQHIKSNHDSKQQQLASIEAQYQAANLEKDQWQDTLKLEETRLRKSRVRLNEVKNSFEYHALRREVEGTERSNAQLVAQIEARQDELNKLEENIAQQKAVWRDVAVALHNAENQACEKSAEYQRVLEEIKSLQQKGQQQVDPALLSRYRLIRTKYRDAVASVIQGICQGCFMNIPPQMTSKIAHSDEVMQCPNCQRLVYVPTVVQTSE